MPLLDVPHHVMTDEHHNHATICDLFVKTASVNAVTGIVFNVCREIETVGMPMTTGSHTESILLHMLTDQMDDLMAMDLMDCLTRSGLIGGQGVEVRIV